MALRVTVIAIVVSLLLSGASSLFAGDASSVMCDLSVKERYQYYDIEGATLDELRMQMKQNGTKGDDGITYSGLTTWDIRYVYDIANDGGRYRVKSAQTKVDILYRLPRMPAAGSDPELAALWSNYAERLLLHEFGHKDLALKTASELNEMFASLSSYATADELDEEINRRTDEKFKRLKAVQIEYDHETRHGETQGALLPAAPPARLAGV